MDNALLVSSISTHSAREDGDGKTLAAEWDKTRFQPTPPARTETFSRGVNGLAILFQPTPPARTETAEGATIDSPDGISTHSAREDGDQMMYDVLVRT